MNPLQGVLIRYHEIALKGANRAQFEERLALNAKKQIERFLSRTARITRRHGRILIDLPYDPPLGSALQRVFGISSFSPIRTVPTSLDALTEAAVAELRSHIQQSGMPKTFRVRTKRSEKALTQSSAQIDYHVGGHLQDLFPEMKVDLKAAEFTIGIELRHGHSYLWTEKLQAAAGLPVGMNAPVLCLLSGGIDSPVAAIKMLRRGSPTSFVHFYGAPFVGAEALEKVEDLVRAVNLFQPRPRPLLVVPFGKIQERIALATNPKLRTLLYRRLMIRIAAEIAEKQKIQALVTGESLGQVASQTLENMTAINSATRMPILRPLVSYDKDEIIDEARKWGTFGISIRPAADCCTLFADRHPAIRANASVLEEEEKKFPLQDFIQEALSAIEVRR